ncbi:transporter substrate-binding domain-containing protein [Vibrio aestuarianus]|uniref:hybrid sensor histidine kinase/response regulator n=1 Tax=Vibrio aestuarianus TaxID=28171 RepID=UPI001559CFF3|nr:transporter substrate-binding domain-containing protein [Vibrio aestuarianus]NGZ14670.1 transporter substrate-binding domain-containing protein [Vibrio aestuarianus]NKZ50818.1 transporter substrate-binding domain-containing protein [Vibrio aestuarianus]
MYKFTPLLGITLQRILALFAIIVGLLSNFAYAADYLSDDDKAYLKNKSSITIGALTDPWQPYWGGFEGELSGIHHDYAVGIARELDIPILYRGYPNVFALLEAARKGEVDIVIGFGKTPEREKEFIFTEPLYENVRIIWLKDETLINKPLQRLTWSCVKNTSYCQLLEEYGYANIIAVQSYEDSIEIIRNGDADATITNLISLNYYLNNSDVHEGKIVYDDFLGVQKNRILLSKNNEKLKEILDSVIVADSHGETSESINSENLYFLNDQGNLKLLTKENHSRIIKYTIEEDMYPMSYINSQGQIDGYIHELLNFLASKTILEFEYVPANGRNTAEMLLDHDVDLLPVRNIESIDFRDFITTRSYTSVEFGFIESKNKINNGVTAILDRTGGFYQGLSLSNDIKKVKIYDDLTDVLTDVELGEIKNAFINKDLINKKLINNGWSNEYVVLENPSNIDLDVEIGMMVRKDSNILKDMLDRALSTVDETDIELLKYKHARINVHYGYDKQTVVTYGVLTASLLLAVIFLTFSRLSISLKKTKLSTEQLSWLTGLMDSIPSMIFISDSKGELILSNKAYRENFKACSINPNCPQRSTCSFANPEHIPDEDNFSNVIHVPEAQCKMGGKHYLVTKKPVLHPKGGMNYYLTVFNDITELKETEIALRYSNEQALEAVEARNNFLAVISHELRTPIAAMLGLMEILSSRLKSEESRMLLTNAVNSAERLKHHVNDILDFSKIEAKQLQLDISQHDLLDELCPILRSFEVSAKLKGLEFVVNCDPTNILYVKFDALRLNQIINNILSNALKFTEQGRITVDIQITTIHLSIVINDTGCGMSQEHINSIFEPFVQADKSITRRYGGTGLGMSIVSNLVSLMGGKILVDSELGKGSSVAVNIPIEGEIFDGSHLVYNERVTSNIEQQWLQRWGVLITEPLEEYNAVYVVGDVENYYPDLLMQQLVKDQPSSKPAVSGDKRQKLKGHILVVDDEPINRLLMKKQLTELGVDVTLAVDGVEAMNVLHHRACDFDLIITDCHMPNMDGFELTRTVKKEMVVFADKPIIGCTAEDSRIATEKAKAAGIDKIIYKPYSLSQLYQVLSGYLAVQESENKDPINWLDEYNEEERQEMAEVVVDSLCYDIEQLEQIDCDYKSIAHRVKGSAGALNLSDLALLARKLEQVSEPKQVEEEKVRLILAMKKVVEQAQAWLLARGVE